MIKYFFIYKNACIKISAIIIFFIISSASLYPITAQSLYENIKNVQSKYYPSTLSVELRGDIVNKQVATIPAQYKTKTPPKLIFHLNKKNAAASLVLENVSTFYRNMFNIFEPVIETTGIYFTITKYKDYSTFSKYYTLSNIAESGNKITATVTPKESNKKDYSIEYTLDKDTFLIEKCVYYFKKNVRYNLSITYQNIDDYVLPKSIVYSSTDKAINSKIEFDKPVIK